MQRKSKIVLTAVLIAVWLASLVWLVYAFNGFNVRTKVVEQTRPTVKVDNSVSNARRQSIQHDATTSHVNNLDKRGLISIPKLSIFEPIYNDAYSTYGLRYGANQVINNRSDKLTDFGVGNVVIASHNYADGKFGFGPLQQKVNRNDPYITNGYLQSNDWLNDQNVYLANQQGIFVYRITGQDVVKLSDRTPLESTTKPTLTLLTCLEPNDSFRIITKAKLINAYSWDKAPAKLVNYFDKNVQQINIRPN